MRLFRWSRVLFGAAAAFGLCCAVPWAWAQALVSPPIAQVFDRGLVWAVAVQADGKVVIGGQFASVGGLPRRNLARLNLDGSVDASWDPAPDGVVTALAIDAGASILVGGSFSSIGGQSRNNAARLSGSGTGAADPTWNPNANGPVQALALDSQGNVYAGGSFTSIGGQPRANLAKLPASGTGAADPTWDAGTNQAVYALAVEGPFLYVGGTFTTLGGQARGRLGRVSTFTSMVDTAWSANLADEPWGRVWALAPDGAGSLYIGGVFSAVGGQARTHLAKVSTSGGSVDPAWNPVVAGGALFGGSIRALAPAGGSIYVGGEFTSIGGQSRSGLARLSATGVGAADPWDPAADAGAGVFALALQGNDRVHVGGAFQSIGGQPGGAVAALSTATAAADPAWPVVVSSQPGYVASIARDASGRTIIGGRFIAMGDRATVRANIARLNADGSLDSTWNPVSDGVVYSLAVDGSGDVYAGGVFTRIGGRPRSNIAKLSGSGAGAADATWNPGANSTAPYGGVDTLVLDGAGALYAGGYFTRIGGEERSYLAKLSTSGAGTVDAAWNPSPNGLVWALALADDGNLYVGGWYSSIGGLPRRNIAKVSAAGAGAVDATWIPDARCGSSGWVSALALHGPGHVFVAGDFCRIGGEVRTGIAKISTEGTGAADASWKPLVGTVYGLATDPFGNIYVGGSFTSAGGLGRNNIAKLSAYGAGPVDPAWNPNAGGSVSALAADGGGVYMGGSFASIAGQSRASYAAFGPPSLPGPPVIGTATSGNGQVAVAFSPPASDGGAPITSYAATCDPGGLPRSGTTSPIVLTGLANGTTYACSVTATNGVGTGPASAISNSVTPAPTLPGPPSIGTASASNAQASVSFTAPASDGGSAITAYTATSSPGGISASGPASPIVVTGLTNFTAYTFTVTATNAVGTGPASAPSNTVTPVGPRVPGAPVVTRAAPANGQATLYFSAPLDQGTSPVTGYSATCNPGSLAASATASPITFAGLANETMYTCTVAAINAVGTGAASAPVTVRPTASPAPQLTFDPAAIDFGSQSMGFTSPARTVTLANPGAGTLVIDAISVSDAAFARTHDCTVVPPGGSCSVNVTFTPAPAPGAINAAVASSGILAVTGNLTGTVPVSGVGERSLVSHYYRSILRREPDAGGKAYWSNEAARVAGELGANVNEVWFALSSTFFASPEYAAFNRDNAGFLTDLYNTFFNRAPDPGGLAYWLSNLEQGMPREVALAAFMFSPEFRSLTTAIFGDTSARPEVDAVVDFYRGLLSRLPDTGGFTYWRDRFRSAQCRGAPAVVAEAEAISSSFARSPEYTVGRNRSDAQYVGDLYNAFLRRGGDLQGVLYWIDQVATGRRTREQVRVEFRNSFEFQERVSRIIQAGCLPPNL